MSLFDQLVGEALRSRGDLTTLRPVVEKELLHHDILRELSNDEEEKVVYLTHNVDFCEATAWQLYDAG